jgi:heme oxygenase
MIQITNLTFSYNQREDRIIFTINHNNYNERIDFYVTRKKIIELLNGFDLILINICENGKLFKTLYQEQTPLKHEPQKTLQDEKQPKWEKAISDAELNLTKAKIPILLDALSYSFNNNKLIFKFISQNIPYAISTMDCELFQKTLSSLMRVIPFVSWGISRNILD